MAAGTSATTSVSLIRRLAHDPVDQSAWVEFVDRYGAAILRWARAWGLQDADALDVSQNVLHRVYGQVSQFAYDPSKSFRGWLRTIVEHAACDAVRCAPRELATGESATCRILENQKARADLAQRFEQEYDLELLEQASNVVQQRVAYNTWKAYELTARAGTPVAEVARVLGMTAGAVYQAKSEVLRRLREEVNRLSASGGP